LNNIMSEKQVQHRKQAL